MDWMPCVRFTIEVLIANRRFIVNMMLDPYFLTRIFL